MNDPAWQALTPDIVRRENHAPAVALSSVGFNVARAFGPALGGLVIAATSSGVAFLLNAASFFGVIFFLFAGSAPASSKPKLDASSNPCATASAFLARIRWCNVF